MTIAKVWIDEGCIACSLCMDLCPEVFLVPDGEQCKVKPQAADFFTSHRDKIIQSAEDCPVEVIKVDPQ
jgi:ferredoxin